MFGLVWCFKFGPVISCDRPLVNEDTEQEGELFPHRVM
jgi:hypothetical protein